MSLNQRIKHLSSVRHLLLRKGDIPFKWKEDR
jgi:hypothetical protein